MKMIILYISLMCAPIFSEELKLPKFSKEVMEQGTKETDAGSKVDQKLGAPSGQLSDYSQKKIQEQKK